MSWDGHKFSGITLGIGAPPGYIAQQKLAEMKVLSSKNTVPQKGMVLVALGRMDGYVVARSAGRKIIEKFELSDSIRALSLPFMQSLLYLPVSKAFYKKHPQVAEKLWHSLAKIRKEQGQRLLKKYENL
ncbi:hypothetical protein [Dongshaea marina]|uniref:hypothetical protein n=1 Tax=Dongshaea marina TaxID=2047966 RepID=UPI000D3E7ECA|nr:hypothetical protein [Dongshaea marina]